MRNRSFAVAFAVSCALLVLGAVALAQPSPAISSTTSKDSTMTHHASGTFDVKLTPQTNEQAEDANLGRMLIDKQFYGDLAATSKGQMLSAMTAVKGSAGYVAIEKVSGALYGRTGSFVLQHSGIMKRGAPELTITVVPDSGTDQLAGLAGKMTINIVEGKHFYAFEYTLDKTP